MKSFETVTFDGATCRRELDDFRLLLAQNPSLPERKLIKPFFAERKQLSAFIGTYIPRLGADLLAYEWQIHGDFSADIVVGNRKTGMYCMVEFENGDPDSIFVAHPPKNTKEWSRALERGFSQLVDWLFALDDFSHTKNFSEDFGSGHVKFHGLLVIGRSAGISEAELRRLKWREEKVIVNSHPIHCVTYDELYDELNQRLTIYSAAATGMT